MNIEEQLSNYRKATTGFWMKAGLAVAALAAYVVALAMVADLGTRSLLAASAVGILVAALLLRRAHRKSEQVHQSVVLQIADRAREQILVGVPFNAIAEAMTGKPLKSPKKGNRTVPNKRLKVSMDTPGMLTIRDGEKVLVGSA